MFQLEPAPASDLVVTHQELLLGARVDLTGDDRVADEAADDGSMVVFSTPRQNFRVT